MLSFIEAATVSLMPRHLGDVAFEGGLGEGGLQLDRFLQALGGGELLAAATPSSSDFFE